MEENFRRVPPPPPPRPNIPPRPPVQNAIPINNANVATNETVQMTEVTSLEPKSKTINPKLKIALLIIGAIVCFVGVGVCAYLCFA